MRSCGDASALEGLHDLPRLKQEKVELVLTTTEDASSSRMFTFNLSYLAPGGTNFEP